MRLLQQQRLAPRLSDMTAERLPGQQLTWKARGRNRQHIRGGYESVNVNAI